MNKPYAFDDVTIQAMFGHEAAENEDVARLRDYYFKGDVYNRAIAKLPLRVLVGHKGTGKSALFAVALQENRDAGAVALLVKPDDVLEIAVGETDLLRATRSWKDGLLRLIYDRSLKELGVDDPAAALRYAGTAGRVVQAITEICKPVVDKYASVSSVKKMATARFLENNEIYVYLDDLDRGWTGDKLSILRLSALLNALRDLSSDNPRLFFRVAMRSDVYYLVRTSDESTDKVEGSVVWHSWTNHEILAMMVKRLETFFGRTANESDLMGMRQEKLASYLSPVFDPTFYGQGHWSNIPVHRVLMSLIRKRPRDLVKLCTLAAQKCKSRNSNVIITKDLNDSFETYSQGRLQDTVNEFRSELPAIEKLLLGMKPNKKEHRAKLGYTYTTDALLAKLKTIQEQSKLTFSGDKPSNPKLLSQFLYKINFLTARKQLDDGTIVRKYFEENKYLSSEVAEFGFDWEVHPAYRWALQPDDPTAIFSSLQLSGETK